jgi:hypothetical protein
LIPIIRQEDKPEWGEMIPLDQGFFRLFEIADQAINSIGSAERAAKGQENASEKSGKAIQLATNNNNVSLSGMNNAVNNSYARWCRIKIERAMCDFTTAQQINYVGDDGIFKQEELKATDFALVGKVTIKTGTGGLINPDQKVQNLAGLAQAGMLTADEAKDAARPAFSRKLGLPADPHTQRIERQITTFLKGPPSKEWAGQWTQYQTEKAAFDQQQLEAQQTQIAEQTRAQGDAAAAPEKAKAQAQMELEREKHRMALEAEQVKAQTAATTKPAESAPSEGSPKGARKKRTTIRRNPDGTMTAESIEEPAPTTTILQRPEVAA